MIDPPTQESTPARTKAGWIRGDGLRVKLLRSHLAIALLGVGMLGAALVAVLSMRSTGVHLAEKDGPLAWHSMRALTGLQRSLAGLRGWMALGEESFIQERSKAWKNEIEPSLKSLEALSNQPGESEHAQQVQHAKELLQDLKEAQWWIEDVARTPGNTPANVLVIKNLRPVGDGIESAITSLFELERNRVAKLGYNTMLGEIADLRFAFASCRTALRVLVSDGTDGSRTRMRKKVDAISDHLKNISASAELLSPVQQEKLDSIRSDFTQYRAFCDDLYAIPRQEWSVARHLLATQSAPIAAEVTRVLETVSTNHNESMERASSQLVTASNIGVLVLVLMVVGMGATATLLSVRSARRITRPIVLLVHAAEDLSDDRVSEDIPVTTADELGRLTGSFNTMRRTLWERQASLRESETKSRAILNTAADGIITINDKGIIESFNQAAERIFGYALHEAVGKNVSFLMPSPHREEHDGYIRAYVNTNVRNVIGKRTEVLGRRKDGSTFPMDVSVNAAIVGERHLFTGIVRDITKRKNAEADLDRFRAAIDASADGIFLIDRRTMRFVDASKSAWTSVGYTHDEILALGPQNINPDLTEDQLAAKFDELIKNRRAVGVIETLHRRKDQSCFPVEVTFRFLERSGEKIVIAVARDINERKWAEQQLDQLHKKMVAASRQAGMAEVATGVLHNVGNVLNSVNVSVTVVADKIRKSKVSSLAKATGLMREHAHELGTFITEDEKGRKLPAYLDKLAQHLASEQGSMVGELHELTKNIDHIKKIVSAQQSHAGSYGVVETVSIAEIMDDALTVNATSLERYGIEMNREYADIPPCALDKQKLLQILVNLVRNAKHAVLDGERENKRLTLRITSNGDARVRVDVIDNGVGITPDNLTKVFSHGFTTKADGHGFGLHSAALAAKEMGGSLSVHSDGPGKGAAFTIDLPFKPVETEATA